MEREKRGSCRDLDKRANASAARLALAPCVRMQCKSGQQRGRALAYRGRKRWQKSDGNGKRRSRRAGSVAHGGVSHLNHDQTTRRPRGPHDKHSGPMHICTVL